MRAIDGKFGTDGTKIFNLVSGEEIPEDEPVFLLRARDHHAIDLLMDYLDICKYDCNDLHQLGIGQIIQRFAAFKALHPERMKQPGITRHLKLAQPAAAAAGQTISSGMARYLDMKGNTTAYVQTEEGGEGPSCVHCGAVMTLCSVLGSGKSHYECKSCGATTGATQPTEEGK